MQYENDSQTFKSKLIRKALSLSKAKRRTSHEEFAKKYIEKKKQRRYKKKKTLVYNLNNKVKKRVIIYFHGGSFVSDLSFFQLAFAKKLAKRTSSILLVPQYDLIPYGNYTSNIENLCVFYQNCLEEYKDFEIIFLGDSAGGNLAIVLAMLAREKLWRVPDHVITISPWLDIQMTCEDIEQDASKDGTIGTEGNRFFGDIWAVGMNKKDYRISPLYGDYHNLGNFTLVYGASGIFASDCQALKQKLQNDAISANTICFGKQPHDFAMYPTKERKIVLDLLENIIEEG